MGMNVGSDADDDVPISDINVVPFTDVMLVLVIIFLIAVPVVIQTIPVKLPNVRYEATTTKPDNVSLTVRNGPGGSCEVYWNMQPVKQAELLDRAVKKLQDQITKVVLLMMGPGKIHLHRGMRVIDRWTASACLYLS